MRYLLISICIVLISLTSFTNKFGGSNYTTINHERTISFEDQLYTVIGLSDEIDKDIFQLALVGYYRMWKNNSLQNKEVITIVDFTKPSNEQRLYLIDLRNKKIIDKSLVAHGKNSGHLKATSFSNIPQSYQSSLGFYTTAETYQGKHGFSLRLDGVEKNINDKARERAIVIHGADYVSNDFCENHGRLGRSFGCPSLPKDKNESIINRIKEKSCLFIYHDNYTSSFTYTTLPNNWWSEIFE